MKPGFALYLHIPFCVRKCTYCDFTSWPCSQAHMAQYAADMLAEAAMQEAIWRDRPVDTVFIGGGTPSVLPPQLMDHLLTTLLRPMCLAGLREFTSEANPGTITREWLDVMVSHGMDRLSMGMQAYQERLLQLLGRIHRHRDVEESVRLARSAGIRRISLDLMFGLPTQTMAEWRETLLRALDLNPSHLSCYGLILEEGTALHRDVQAGRLHILDVELERDMYALTLTLLGEAGYAPYELSNFAKPGEECLHNMGYWTGVPYLGLGVSAASMDWTGDPEYPCIRWTNPVSQAAYHHAIHGVSQPFPTGREKGIAAAAADRPGSIEEASRWNETHTQYTETSRKKNEDQPFNSEKPDSEETIRPSQTVERISRQDAMFEFFMVGLRMTGGVRASEFMQRFGVPVDDVYGDRLRKLVREGLLHDEGDVIRMTRKGMDLHNTLLVELMD